MKKILKSLLFLFTLTFLSSCGEYFDDPLVHKDTGEDINLLVIDFNFFTTNLTYKLLDSESGELIQKEARVRFHGNNGKDIVTYTGERKSEYFTSEGMLELTLDPNIEVSKNSPAVFGIQVEVDGYEIYTKGFQLSTEGRKTLELQLHKISDRTESKDGDTSYDEEDETFYFSIAESGLKSARVESKPFDLRFSMTLADVAKLEGESGLLFTSKEDAYNHYLEYQNDFFVMNFGKSNDFKPEIDLIDDGSGSRAVLFEKLEQGELISLKVAGMKVTGFGNGKMNATTIWKGAENHELFGFFNFEEGTWNYKETVTSFYRPDFTYLIARVLDDAICATGTSVTFQSDMKSGFSINADLFDMNGDYIKSMNFTGNFGDSFVLENMPQVPVKLKFRNENPSFAPLETQMINDPCSGSISIEVQLNPEYKEYQIVLKALCPDDPTIAIAPSYNAQIRIAGSDADWQSVSMFGGVANVTGIPGQDYEMRLLWEEEWEYSEYSTKFDQNGDYAGAIEPGSTITSKVLEDNRIRIEIVKTFEQGICNDMGW